MKSYNGLYARMLDRAEAEAAIVEAARYKRNRPSVAMILENKAAKAEEVCRKLESGTWKPPQHKKQLLRQCQKPLAKESTYKNHNSDTQEKT